MWASREDFCGDRETNEIRCNWSVFGMKSYTNLQRGNSWQLEVVQFQGHCS